jgi:uncharacterized membrane protein
LRDQLRTGSRRRQVARGGVVVFIVSSLKELDAYTARRATESEFGAVGVLDDEGRTRTATAAITILRPIEQVYAFIRDFYNFPSFMAHLDSVETHGGGRSHWRLRMIGGKTFEWDAEITDDRPGELVAWRSLPGGDLDNRGTIRLWPAPGGRGTEVHADIRYTARAGGLNILFAKLLNIAPGQQAKADLRRLKQLLETGEIVHSDASIHRLMHAAQPPTDEFVQRQSTEEAV